MALFPLRRRGNRRVVEVLQSIQERREQVVPAAKSAIKRLVTESGMPDEVKAFLEPLADEAQLVGYVFTKFANDLPQADADSVIDGNPDRGRLLELVIGFIERGGLNLILEFILAVMGAFSK